MRYIYLLPLVLIGFAQHVFAQKSMYLKNPSFEMIPRQNHPPTGWFDCNFDSESPVDVHGSDTEFFGVKEFADDGECFVGMVTRDNGTYEGISAKLLQPLLKDSTYRLTISVNKSPDYQSISRTSSEPVNFNSDVVFEIWAGYHFCNMDTRLLEYNVDEQGVWTPITFYITPEKNITFLGLYVRHGTPSEDTNGHVLIDNLQLTKVDPEALSGGQE